MPAVRELVAGLVGVISRPQLRLRVALLPGAASSTEVAPLLDLRADPERDPTLEPIQLLENEEYRFEFFGENGLLHLSTDRPEVFAPDDASGRTGRLRPGSYTGTLGVKVFEESRELGSALFEVRSRKLDYLTEYRRMLADIAQVATEVVMEGFAVSTQSFIPDVGGDPVTLYQRFAFLQGLLSQTAFQAALQRVLSRPYQEWQREEQPRTTGQGIRAGSDVARQLRVPGRRRMWPDNPLGGNLPATMTMARTEATLDNAPNRFVKFALRGWRQLVQELHDEMAANESTPTFVRGLRESQALVDTLDSILGEELFREVGDLEFFPSANQAIQKREGYRDVLHAYVLSEVAPLLTWSGGEDVYEAGQRNVSTLYEFWTYIALAQIVAKVCEVPFHAGSLLARVKGGLNLELRRGAESALTYSSRRLGRQIKVTTWYNRRFRRSALGREGSWSTEMQPDMSVKIEVDTGDLDLHEPVWLHFDAKYRLVTIEQQFGSSHEADTGASSDAQAKAPTTARRDDLNKMHAYRDAIRSSAGAYILYPGDQKRAPFRAFHEILPGLGAFVLRPTISGDAEGVTEIQTFINAVLDHVANQASQHERSRWWQEQSYSGTPAAAGLPAATFLARPPADARVLVGFVKDVTHRAWIHGNLLYNLRAGDRRGAVRRELLNTELLLLWGDGLGSQTELWAVTPFVEALSQRELLEMGYPKPGGERYYCLRLARRYPGSEYVERDRIWIEDLLRKLDPNWEHGAPVVMSWVQLQHQDRLTAS